MKTATKIKIAKLLRSFILLFRRESRVDIVKRHGVSWELDLNEGIDLSIYLFGGFESESTKIYKKLAACSSVVVFDIGANCGSHSIFLASLLDNKSKIYAFEPTGYAYDKLVKNASLNPVVAEKITLNHCFLSSDNEDRLPSKIYSSWDISHKTDETHTLHFGIPKSTNGAKIDTLDSYVLRNEVGKIDFIKLDVDGYELDVLGGALKSLRRFKPVVYFEYAPYVQVEQGYGYDEILEFFRAHGYDIYIARNMRKMTGAISVRVGESINLVAIIEDRLKLL